MFFPIYFLPLMIACSYYTFLSQNTQPHIIFTACVMTICQLNSFLRFARKLPDPNKPLVPHWKALSQQMGNARTWESLKSKKSHVAQIIGEVDLSNRVLGVGALSGGPFANIRGTSFPSSAV